MDEEEIEAQASIEDMVQEIEKLSRIFARLNESRLKRRTVVLLIHDATKVSKRDINAILDAVPDLANRYLEDL